MSRLFAIALAILAGLVPAVARAEGEGAVLLVDRRADSLALYLRLPARELPAVFGGGAEALAGQDGTVDIDRLFDGTFPIADRIFASVETRLGGAPVAFEALSMMVHDPRILPDFATPYDAELSIAICTSPETVRGMTVDDLDAYMGFFAWKVDGLSDLTLQFPALGRDALNLRVLEFADFRPLPPRDIALADGAALTLAAPARPIPATAIAGIVLLVAVSGLAISFLRRCAGRAREAIPGA